MAFATRKGRVSTAIFPSSGPGISCLFLPRAAYTGTVKRCDSRLRGSPQPDEALHELIRWQSSELLPPAASKPGSVWKRAPAVGLCVQSLIRLLHLPAIGTAALNQT